MNILNIKRFIYSVKNTEKRRLLNRLKLVIKRRFNRLIKICNIPRYNGRNRTLSEKFSGIKYINSDSAKNRKNFSKTKFGKAELSFINIKVELNKKLDWHRKDLNKGTRLWKLNLHYFEWISETSNTDFVNYITDWIENNTIYQKDYWLDSWNSYAISIRTVIWMTELSIRKERISDSKVKLISLSIQNQLIFLYRNIESDIRGNHIIKNIRALYFGFTFFPALFSEKEKTRINKLLLKELNKQINPDGYHYELTPGYHIQVFEDLYDVYNLLNSGKTKDVLQRKLRKMGQIVNLLFANDNDVFKIGDTCPCTHNDRSYYARISKNLGIRNTNFGIHDLYNSGIIIAHYKYLKILYKYNCIGNKSLPAHCHADLHTYEVFYNGNNVITDCGVFEYNSGHHRDIARATKSHNCLTLNDKNQVDLYGAFRSGRWCKSFVNEKVIDGNNTYIKSSHNGYSNFIKKLITTRAFKNNGHNIEVVDSIDSVKTTSTVVSRIHFAKFIRLEPSDKEGQIKVKYKSDDIAAIKVFNKKFQILNFDYYPDMNKVNQGVVLIIHLSKDEKFIKYNVIFNS